MRVESAVQSRSAEAGRWFAGFCMLLSAVSLLLLAPSVEAAKKVTVKAKLSAVKGLNPDYQGRPSPVKIIVFQLASSDAFASADFFSLFDPDSGVLGGDLLGRTEILLQPGEVRDWNPQFDRETRFVGVIAAYRDIENSQWRATVELPRRGFIGRFFKKNKLRIAVGTLAVKVSTK